MEVEIVKRSSQNFYSNFFAGIYLVIQIFACLLVTEPKLNPDLLPASEEEAIDEEKKEKILMDQVQDDGEAYVTPREAFKRKELYLLWFTR